MRTSWTVRSLIASAGIAAALAVLGHPVLAVLAVVPGYLLVAYVLILVSTLVPGAERRRFLASRGAALSGPTGADPIADRSTLHRAYLAAPLPTQFSGDGFVSWLTRYDVVFQSFGATQARQHHYKTYELGGFALEVEAPAFLPEGSLVRRDAGPVVRLEMAASRSGAVLWLQPDDLDAFVRKLREARVTDISNDAPRPPSNGPDSRDSRNGGV